MKIKILYFGSTADIAGIREETADSPRLLDELNDLLRMRYPGLKELNYRFSVNRKMATGNEQLNEGDEVALLPPFAGG
jgi:molybdopterin converting factor small subunit